MVQEFNKNWIKNQKSAYEMIKEFVDEQGIKLKEENMEDRNKTAAELIADLQNQLDKANKRIDELVVVNKSLNKALIKEKNKHQRATEIITHLKSESNVQKACYKISMYKNILNAIYGTTGLGLYYESTDDGYTKYLEGLLLKEKAKNNDLQNELDKANNHIEELTHKNTKLIVENVLLEEDDVRMNRKYCEYNQAAQDAWNENNKIKNEIEKLKNENEYLEGIIDWVISENDDMSKEITKWHNKYTKEKVKHDKATKKIDELKKHQKDELAWSDKRRHDNIDSLLYSYWGLKEYYQESKCNKNEANDAKE